MRMKWRKVAETFERKIAEIVERFVSWSRIMAFEGVRIKSFPPKASHVQACFRKSHCELEITIPLRLVVILARKRITIRNRARKIWGLEGRGVPFPSLGRTRVIRAKVMLLLFGAPLSRHSRRSDGLKKGQGLARYFQRGRRDAWTACSSDWTDTSALECRGEQFLHVLIWSG